MQYMTLDFKRNKFRFVCPIFNAETSMASCVMLRNMVWISNGPTGKRTGCQACIKSGKCPATAIVQRIIYGKNVPDNYGSVEPKVGKLSVNILERVRNVIVQDIHMSQVDVPQNERELIETANARIDKMIATAPEENTDGYVRTRSAASTPRKSAPKPKAAAKVTNTIDPSLHQAALTGDMTAVINAGE